MGRKNTWAHIFEDLPEIGKIGENTISGAELYQIAVNRGVPIDERAFKAALERYFEKGILKRTPVRFPVYLRREIRELSSKLDLK